MMPQSHAGREWYKYALAFSRAPSDVRAATSKQYRSWMMRIAKLMPHIGAKLDEMKAPLTVCRYVASTGFIGQNERAVEALAKLAERQAREAARLAPPDPRQQAPFGGIYPAPPARPPGERRGRGRPRSTSTA